MNSTFLNICRMIIMVFFPVTIHAASCLQTYPIGVQNHGQTTAYDFAYLPTVQGNLTTCQMVVMSGSEYSQINSQLSNLNSLVLSLQSSLSTLQNALSTSQNSLTAVLASASQPIDYSQLGFLWTFAFSAVVLLWWISKHLGILIGLVKRG